MAAAHNKAVPNKNLSMVFILGFVLFSYLLAKLRKKLVKRKRFWKFFASRSNFVRKEPFVTASTGHLLRLCDEAIEARQQFFNIYMTVRGCRNQLNLHVSLLLTAKSVVLFDRFCSTKIRYNLKTAKQNPQKLLLNRKSPSQAQHYQQAEDNEYPKKYTKARAPAIKQEFKDGANTFK
jgi:hypothetical protein